MRVRWRDFELPARVVCKQDTLTPYYGEFIAEPFEQGMGHTIGNSLRRILLSAIAGYAVTSVKIEGVKHEFSTLPGVLEDISDIILNVKKLRFRIDGNIPANLSINVHKKGEVTGNDVISDENTTVCNPDLLIATLTVKTKFKMEMEAKRGRGYVTAEENIHDQQDIGTIPIASIFSPVNHVRYKVENTRVGKITNYDRLILSITTDGTVSPEMALVEASKILRKHLNPFIQYFELGKEIQEEQQLDQEKEGEADRDREAFLKKLEHPIETLDLGVRASNCLSAEGIHTIGDLVSHSETELLHIRNFGKTSLNEIKEKLQKLELSLGMSVDVSELQKTTGRS